MICGLFFFPHTVAKLRRNIPRASILFDKVGLRPPRFFVAFTAAMEVIAAVELITGLYPRLAALIAAAILLFVASYAIARAHSLMWRWQHPGIEYMVFWAIVCLCVGFLA